MDIKPVQPHARDRRQAESGEPGIATNGAWSDAEAVPACVPWRSSSLTGAEDAAPSPDTRISMVRTGFYSAVGTGARLLAALVIIKVVAWTSGPAGVGKLGQFMSLMSVLAVLAGGGIGTGIVKYVAEYKRDPVLLSRLLGAALWYGLCTSVFVGTVCMLMSNRLAWWLLDDPAYANLIRVLAVVQIGIALMNYILAVINGFMDVKRLAFIQVTGSMVGMVLAIALVQWLGLFGALLALVLTQVSWLLVGLPTWWRSPYFQPGMLRVRFDVVMSRRLAAFSIMTLAAALFPTLASMLIRDHLAASHGWREVGYWQAVTKVSDAYLLFLTSAFQVYYLPKLAATHARGQLLRELRNGYRYLLPSVALLAWLVYVFRTWITQLLFSSDFGPANELYAPQLFGDVIRIASFVLSYLMLAKAMTRTYVISEIVFAASYVGLVYLATARFGVVGAMYAFCANYSVYLVFNLFVARHVLAEASP